MDRYDDKAREIVAAIAAKHGAMYDTPAARDGFTLLLRAAVELRAESPAATGGLPTAGEWNGEGSSRNRVRRSSGMLVAEAWTDGEWVVYAKRSRSDIARQGIAADLASAMAAADAWARANPDKLDWRLPDESARPQPAPRPVVHKTGAIPFTARCGADEPNQATTTITDNVTCKACRRGDAPASETASGATVDEVVNAVVDESMRAGRGSIEVWGRFLRALTPEERARGMAAIGGGK